MKTRIERTLLLWILTACIGALAIQVFAAGSGRIKNVTLAWDHDWRTNEIPVGYIVYEHDEASTNFVGFTAHTNRAFTISNVVAGVHVYSVTATNHYWESEPSDKVFTPQVSDSPTLLRIVVVLTNSP